MNAIVQILDLLIGTFGTLFLVFVLLRFFLQVARADFYNPFSQTIVKVTNPLLMPLRKVIPGMFGVDTASIVLALLVHFIVAQILCLVYFGTLLHPGKVLWWSILGTIKVITYVLMIAGLVLVVSSFIAPFSTNPILVLVRQLMEPLMRPFQKVLPAMGGLDFSLLFVFLGITIVQIVVQNLAIGASVDPRVIIGF